MNFGTGLSFGSVQSARLVILGGAEVTRAEN